MTQAQLEDAVAAATGEDRDTVHHLGFGLVPDAPAGDQPEALYLVVTCPHCRRPVAYPGQLRDGSYALAECLACDVLFAYDVADVAVSDRPGA